MNDEKFVLVVEDDEFYSDIYKRKFENEKIRAVVVGTGMHALEFARKEKPTLVLMDAILPGKDGFETLQDFKSDPNLKDIKIIMLSNLSQEEDIIRAKQLGAEDFIVKANVPMNEIVQLVKNYVS